MKFAERVISFFKAPHHPGLVRLLYGIILLAAFVCLIHVADASGVQFDEMTSWQRFSSSIYEARHDYHSTNNHVLNSIFICLAGKLFGSYEHYIRIFPMISGILYCLSAAYVIRHLLSNLWLQALCLIFVISIWWIFFFLTLARGYGFALSALMLYLAVVFLFIRHPVAFKYVFVPGLILSLLNLYAVGAMISSAFGMAAVNAVYVLGFSFMTIRENKRKFITMILNGLLIFVLSSVMIYLFYRPILDRIMNVHRNRYVSDISASWEGWSSFVPFIHELLFQQTFYTHPGWRWINGGFLLLAAAGLVVLIVCGVRSVRIKNTVPWMAGHRHGLMAIGSFLAYMSVLFFYAVVGGRSPGLHRNQVFLMPLFVLSCFWLIDYLLRTIPRRGPGRVFSIAVWAIVLIVVFHPRPYLWNFTQSGLGMSRPLVHQLKQLDPDRQWNLTFSKNAMKVRNNFRYYMQFDYNISITNPDWNVYVCRPDEQPPGRLFLNYDYFLKYHNMVIVLNYQPDFKTQIVEIKPRDF